MIYDHPPIQSLEDPSVTFMNEVVEKMGNAALPGAHLVEIFPCLRHLPRFLSKWRRDAEKTFVKFNSKYEEMFLKVKNEFVSTFDHSIAPILITVICTVKWSRTETQLLLESCGKSNESQVVRQ